MQRAVRNLGRPGLAATAISAVDAALWDLKARILDLPLATLLGRYRETVPIYGSGGFTTYTDDELREQLAGWVERDGCAFGQDEDWQPIRDDDPRRVAVAKKAIGERDAVRGRQRRLCGQAGAGACADAFARSRKSRWFEEPVSSDDLRWPARRCASARRPAWTSPPANTPTRPTYVRSMLEAGAGRRAAGGRDALWRRHRVSCRSARLCEAHQIDLSGHCAPALASACRLRGAAIAPSRMVS